ncbi:MAG: hypothetical protein ACXIU8_02315 [Alkalilacustris sp.]
MSTPSVPPAPPRASNADRWEYIVMAGSNRPPGPKVERSRIDLAMRLIASPQALVFLSVVMAVVALAPQTPGAHNWAAERAAQQAPQAVGSVTP